MSGRTDAKLNSLIRDWTPGTVATQLWLTHRGIYRQLAAQYVHSGWLDRLGPGAYKRAGDTVDWRGAVFALQAYDELNVHPGGLTALALLGYGHFVQTNGPLWLFGAPQQRLPAWFAKYDWGVDVRYQATSLFSAGVGLTAKEMTGFRLQMSTPERAMLEVLSDVPAEISVADAALLMRGLTTARPTLVQQLLEACGSIKAKRLFLLLAEHEGHPWVHRLHRDAFDLGSGKRVLGGGGHYYPNYSLSLPEPLSTMETAQ